MTIVARNLLAKKARELAQVGSCWSPSFSPDGEELAFVSDLTGSPQVWRISWAGGFPQAVTALEDQVGRVSWSPKGDWLAMEAAPGGGMNSQIYLARPNGLGLRRISPGSASNNWLNRWAPAGDALFFSSNMRDAAAMDCFSYDLGSGETALVSRNAGTGMVEDVSSDGRQILVRRVAHRGDSNIYCVDLAKRAERLLTAHVPPADFSKARFSRDAGHVYLISNDQSDMASFCRLPLAGEGKAEILKARADAELAEFALSGDHTMAALVWNRAGRHELELLGLDPEAAPIPVDLPGEIVDSLAFSPDGSALAMRITGARLPSDIWLLDLDRLDPRQMTRSPHVGIDLAGLAGAKLESYRGHDGLPLSGWLYTPADGEPPYPLVLSFHGGPEAQEQPRFRPDYQSLLWRGIAVFAPNVRGSSGFGKRFVNLDNGALRFNAIRDIASTVEHLLDSGLAARGRIGIMGGSYGGYMTMAGLTAYPDLFAAGVNLYGVVNFKTFFAHTEPWMANISKIEYGDPDTQGDMLDALSPINQMERVVAPVCVLHGANDTNVPVHEAEQVVEALRRRGIPVEYTLFPDEGHGFRKEENRIAAAVTIAEFFARHLLAD